MRNDIAKPAAWTGAAASSGTTSKRRHRALNERFGTLIRYALVGSIGYVVYLGLITLVYDLKILPFLPAQNQRVDLGLFTHKDSLFLLTTLVGTQASIIAVFVGHTLWTFADTNTKRKPLWLRFAQFEARALISTLGILTVTVNAAVLAGVHHYVAVPAGLVVTFAWNWFWDSKVIWKKGEHTS